MGYFTFRSFEIAAKKSHKGVVAARSREMELKSARLFFACLCIKKKAPRLLDACLKKKVPLLIEYVRFIQGRTKNPRFCLCAFIGLGWSRSCFQPDVVEPMSVLYRNWEQLKNISSEIAQRWLVVGEGCGLERNVGYNAEGLLSVSERNALRGSG